jgi:hypothetical protein
MSDVLSIEEIRRRHDGEWVLLEDVVSDPNTLRVQSGRVACHSKDRAAIDSYPLGTRFRRIAILFMGEPPADMEFALSPFLVEDIPDNLAMPPVPEAQRQGTQPSSGQP